jgi:hypothetical protein
MMDLVGIVNDFNYESNIQLNPKKCEILKIGNDFYSDFRIVDPISKNENVIDCSDNTKVIRYLGAHLQCENSQK